MANIQGNVSDLHAEHNQWREDLLFFKEEINTFQDRLREVVSKNPSDEVLVWVEHFKKQFVIQNELIDEIFQSIRSHEHEIKTLIEKDTSTIDHAFLHDHAEERGKVRVFTRFYQELKNDLNKFLAINLVGQAARQV